MPETEQSGMSAPPYEPIDYATFELSPEGQRIEDPLQRVRAYDDRLRKDLFARGLLTPETDKQITDAGADQAFRAGHILDRAEYDIPLRQSEPDDNFMAGEFSRTGNSERAQAVFKYQSFLTRPDTAPETLERAAREAAIDPAERAEALKKAVRQGRVPFAVTNDGVLEVDPELGALSREEILDLADTVPGGIDPRALPLIEKELTRKPGSNYTPAQEKQETVFAKFIADQGKTDEFLGTQLENAISEYNRAGSVSRETREALDRTLASLDPDNEFSPASRSRYLDDMIKRAAKPEAFDPGNPEQHVQYLNDGSVWLPDQVVFNEDEYKGTLDKLTSITPEQKQRALDVRAARLDAIAPMYVDAMGADPAALDFYTKAKAEGKTDSQIATEWFGDKEKYSAISNRMNSAGMAAADATKGFVESIRVLATGDRDAMASLMIRRENMSRNEEYARLFGDSYGIGQSAINTASQVAVDLIIAGAVSTVATPAAGAALLGVRAAARSAVSALAREAISATTKSTVRSFIKSGAMNAAETLAKIGDDVVLRMAQTAGRQTALASSTFARAAGSSYVSTYSALDAQTNANGSPKYTEEEKRKIALGNAFVTGISTAGITMGFGEILGPGVEGLVTGKVGTGALRRVFRMTDEQIAAASKNSAIAILRSAGQEAPEEAVDQLLSGVYEKIATGEEFRLGPALKEALEAGAVGGLLGAGAGAIELASSRRPRNPVVDRLEQAGAPRTAAAVEAATSPATTPAAPDRGGLVEQLGLPPTPDTFSYGDEMQRDPEGRLMTPSGATKLDPAEVEAELDDVTVRLAELKVAPENETEGQKARRLLKIQAATAEKTRLSVLAKRAKSPDGVWVNATTTTREEAAQSAREEIAAIDTEIEQLSVVPQKETKKAAAARESAIADARERRAAAFTRLRAFGTATSAAPTTTSATAEPPAPFPSVLPSTGLASQPGLPATPDTFSYGDESQPTPEPVFEDDRDSVPGGLVEQPGLPPTPDTFSYGDELQPAGPVPFRPVERGGLVEQPGLPPTPDTFSYGDELQPVAPQGDARQIKRSMTGSERAKAVVLRLLNPESRSLPPEYFKQASRAEQPQVELQNRIAAMYDAMPEDDGDNPEVVQAYENLAAEVVAQYQEILNTGIRVEIVDGSPYADSGAMILDVDRGQIKAQKTDAENYGADPSVFSAARHPMLRDSGFQDANGYPMLMNDVFRVVHDFIAHAAFGSSFGPLGEEAAWKAHLATLSDPLAKLALTTETRGQNSWVNYRDAMLRNGMPIKKGEPGYIAPQDRPFATQKFALLPPEAMLLVGQQQATTFTTGVPMRVTAFRGENDTHAKDGRTFWSESESEAATYAKSGTATRRELEFQNPLVVQNWIEAKQALGLPKSATMSDIFDAADAAGHDGITWIAHKKREFIALKPFETENRDALPGRAATWVADGRIPEYKQALAWLGMNAKDAAPILKEAAEAIRTLYPLVDTSKFQARAAATFPGLGDLRGRDKKQIKIPVIDERTGAFTNDPHITALQLSAGLSIPIPAGVTLNPSIKASPDGKHVSSAVSKEGKTIAGKGGYSRPTVATKGYVSRKNQEPYMRSVASLPPAPLSSLVTAPVEFAKFILDPLQNPTEDDLLAYFFTSGKVANAVRSKHPELTAAEVDAVTDSIQMRFLKELREYFIDPDNLPEGLDIAGFGMKSEDAYREYLRGIGKTRFRAKDLDTSKYWSDKGAPASPYYFIRDEVGMLLAGKQARGATFVDLETGESGDSEEALDRAAVRNDGDSMEDAIEILADAGLTEEAMRGIPLLQGGEPVSDEVQAAQIARRFIAAIESDPKVRAKFEGIGTRANTREKPGTPGFFRYSQTLKKMEPQDLFMLVAGAAFINPALVKNTDLRTLLAPSISTASDEQLTAARESNAASVADLKLEGDLRQAVERVARSAKYPRRYRAIMKAVAGMQKLPTLHLVDRPADAFAGMYSASANAIHINLAATNGRGLLDVLAHELLHAATVEAVRNPQTAKAKALRDRLERYRATVAETVPAHMKYAVSNLDEFIAHAATDPEFQRIARESIDGARNVWDKIVDAVASFFGITNRGFVSDLWGFINHGAEYGYRGWLRDVPGPMLSPAAGVLTDEAYFAALDRGDEAAAQQMLDEASLAAHVDPALHTALRRKLAAEYKTQYEETGSSAERISTPQQDAAVTRATNALYAAAEKANPNPNDSLNEWFLQQMRAFNSARRLVKEDRDGNIIPPSQRFASPDIRYTQNPTQETSDTPIDRHLPTPPEGMRYAFEDVRGKYLAYVSRSNPDVITINRAGLAALVEDLDPANAKAVVRKIVNHEIAHHAAFRAFTPDQIQEMASRLTASDVLSIANRYYEGDTDALTKIEDGLRDGTVTAEEMLEEWFRMQAEIISEGGTTEEVLAFHRKNPGVVSRVLEYIRRFIASLWSRVAGPQEDFATRVEINRFMREYRAIKRGWRSETAVPFDAADPRRDNRLMAGRKPSLLSEAEYARHAELEARKDSLTEAEVAEAAALVEKAARKSGYGVGPVFHGSPRTGKFTVFDPTKGRSFGGVNNIGTWFTDERAQAARFAEHYQIDKDGNILGTNPGEVFSTFIKTGRVWDAGDLKNFFRVVLGRSGKTELWEIGPAEVATIREYFRNSNVEAVRITGTAQDAITKGDATGTYYVTFSPEQIKSADPFTGVPLRDRFNEASSDIRYARTPEIEKDPEKTLREVYEPLVLDWREPYDPGTIVTRLLVDRFGDRRISSLTERRSQQLMVSSKAAQRAMASLEKAMKKEKPPTELVNDAVGSTKPFITDAQQKAIDAEFDAAMKKAETATASQDDIDEWTRTAERLKAETPEDQREQKAWDKWLKRKLETLDAEAQAAAVNAAFTLKDALKRAAVTETTSELHRIRNAAMEELEKKHPETFKAVKQARQSIDTISAVIKEFFPEGSYIRHVFDQSGGIYLTRTYRLHHKDGDPLEILHTPEHAEAVEAAKIELSKYWIENEAERIIKEAALTGKFVSKESALESAAELARQQDIGLSLVEDYLLEHGTKAFYHGGTNFKADMTRLMLKKDVPEALRGLMEEVTEPVENLMRTTLNVGMLAASMRFTEDLAQGGLLSGSMVTRDQKAAFPDLIREADDQAFMYRAVELGFGTFDTAKPGYVLFGELDGLAGKQPVSIPLWMAEARASRNITALEGFRSLGKNSKKYGVGKLSDLLAHPTVADVIDSMFEKGGVPKTTSDKAIHKLGGILAGATGVSLGIATLGSVGFYTRNMVGAALGCFANGVNLLSPDGLAASKLAVEAFLNTNSDWVVKLTGLGVLHDDTRPETAKELLKSEIDKPGGLNLLEWLGKVIAKEAGQKAGKWTTEKLARLADVASAIDGVAKATAFFHELKTLQKAYPDKPRTELEQQAAEKVKRTFQARSQTVPVIDSFTSSSFGRLFAPFARFKSEMLRLVAEIPMQAKAELDSDNPVIRARGRQRMAGFIAMQAFAIAGPALLSSLFGVDDEEERALRSALPDYLRSNSIIYANSKDGRSVVSLDFTFANQWSMLGDPISRVGRALMRGEPGEGAEEMAIWLRSQWLEEQIAFGAAMEVLKNQTSDGKKIYLETDGADDKVVKISKHFVGSAFTPQLGKALYRSYQAAEKGVPEDAGFLDTPLGIVVGHAAPVRPRSYLTEDLALRSMRDAAETNRDVRSIGSRLNRRQILSSDDVEDVVNDLHDSSVELNREIAARARGFESLGLTKQQVVREMVKAGFSRERANALAYTGRVSAPSISPDSRRKIIEAGNDAAGNQTGGVERWKMVLEAMSKNPRVIDVRPGTE